jgi:hypothetical protein
MDEGSVEELSEKAERIIEVGERRPPPKGTRKSSKTTSDAYSSRQRSSRGRPY